MPSLLRCLPRYSGDLANLPELYLPIGDARTMSESPADVLSGLVRADGGKIILLVIDGLGGLPQSRLEDEGDLPRTELERAQIPNLDALARRSSVGRVQILPTGLTPGSGPGHLSLFGYDPMKIEFGRGVLEALGSDYPLASDEVAARGNFCTVDSSGRVSDRRAGRPSDAESRVLCERLEQKVALSGAKVRVLPGKQHRFTLIVQASGLGAGVNDNDPQVEGKERLRFEGRDEPSRRLATLVTEFSRQAGEILADQGSANGVLLRGFSGLPDLPDYRSKYGLRAASIAIYPMYRGVASLVGMNPLAPGADLDAQIDAAREAWNDYDFFFLHTKATDQAGHSGEFDAKIEALEEIDRSIPRLTELGADVVMITGDHSTPCVHKEHSWHPVPLILSSDRCLPVEGVTFSERGVLGGDLGTFPAHELMTLALAHAGRLDKYGA